MAERDHGWLGRVVDRLFGWLADHLLRRWEGAWANRQRRRWRCRRAIYRASMRTLRKHPRLALTIDQAESAIAASAHILARLGPGGLRARAEIQRMARATADSRLGRATARGFAAARPHLLRFWQAHLEAWRWAAWLPARLWPRGGASASATDAAIESQPTIPTMPDGVLFQSLCAACGHEVIGTNLRKYARYHCPLCKCQLLVIDSQKGTTMVLRGGERGRTCTQVEKNETEESEPLRA